MRVKFEKIAIDACESTVVCRQTGRLCNTGIIRGAERSKILIGINLYIGHKLPPFPLRYDRVKLFAKYWWGPVLMSP